MEGFTHKFWVVEKCKEARKDGNGLNGRREAWGGGIVNGSRSVAGADVAGSIVYEFGAEGYGQGGIMGNWTMGKSVDTHFPLLLSRFLHFLRPGCLEEERPHFFPLVPWHLPKAPPGGLQPAPLQSHPSLVGKGGRGGLYCSNQG